MHIFRHRQNIYRRRQRKAQTSIFVILGIFMFIAVVIGFFVYSNIQKTKAEEESKKASDLGLQAEEVEKFVNECIRKASFEGLKQLGQTGGYFEIPMLINFKGTSYWHLNSVNIQPFLNQTQERLLEHVNTNVPKCVDEEKIRQLGFSIEKGDLRTSIEYGAADVTIKVSYPLKLSQQDFTKELKEFFNTFDIRYRAIFEAATEANERTFDGNFDEKNPLKNLDYLKSLDFDVSYKSPEADILTFMIIDRKSITPENQNYAFNFAVKLGKSELKRATDLQNKSASNPNVIPYSLFSVDKKAQLDISAGTTISFNGQDVKSISVQQSYPKEAVTKDVPVYKRNKDVVQKQDITYVIDNPVYSFEPTGILFNQFQKLAIFYPPEADDSKGMGILMGKNGFWIPIQSQHFPEQKLVATNILGFTEFTAVGCASQKVKEAVAEHLFEPNAGCYISLAIMIIAIALMVYLFFLAPVLAGGAPVVVTAPASGATVTIGSGAAATVVPAGTAVVVPAGTTVTVSTAVGSSVTTTAGTMATAGTASAAIGSGATATGVSATAATGLGTSGLAGIGSALTLGTVTNFALAVGIGAVFVGVSTTATILGATTDTFYTSEENCQNFYPTCDQNVEIEVDEDSDAEEGQCIPKEGSIRVVAGAPKVVCAQVESCGNFFVKMICKSCSQKCNVEYY